MPLPFSGDLQEPGDWWLEGRDPCNPDPPSQIRKAQAVGRGYPAREGSRSEGGACRNCHTLLETDTGPGDRHTRWEHSDTPMHTRWQNHDMRSDSLTLRRGQIQIDELTGHELGPAYPCLLLPEAWYHCWGKVACVHPTGSMEGAAAPQKPRR